MSGAASRSSDEVSGTVKAATLLMALPPEHAANVLRLLQEGQVERLTTRLLGREPLSPEAQDAVLREAHEIVTAEEYIAAGGVEYARGLLREAFGKDRADDLIERLMARLQSQPFHYLRNVESSQIVLFLHNQHPQIIAVILSYLTSEHAAELLSMLPEHLQPQVSLRLAHMDTVNPQVVAQIETVLRQKLSTVLDNDTARTKAGGVDYLVRVLRQVDRTTERAIIEHLDEAAPELAEEIKKQMFVFENLTQLDDRSVQRVLREVDQRDLALALRGTTDAVRAHIYRNLSQRAADTVREEIENSPPVRLRTIEEAQQRVVEVVRRLEDADEIVVARNSSDVLV